MLEKNGGNMPKLNKRQQKILKLLTYLKEKIEEARGYQNSSKDAIADLQSKLESLIDAIAATPATDSNKIFDLDDDQREIEGKINVQYVQSSYWKNIRIKLDRISDRVDQLIKMGLRDKSEYKQLLELKKIVDDVFASTLDERSKKALEDFAKKIDVVFEESELDRMAIDEESENLKRKREMYQGMRAGTTEARDPQAIRMAAILYKQKIAMPNSDGVSAEEVVADSKKTNKN